MTDRDDSADLYLELLKECLIGRIYGPEVAHIPEVPDDPSLRDAIAVMNSAGISVTRPWVATEDVYQVGRIERAVLERPATLIGRRRLDNVHRCVEQVIADGVPGDLIETGVWRGGATILMRAIVKVRGEDRAVWLADSFEGLPEPDLEAYPADHEFVGHTKLDVGIEDVREQFARYGLLDDGVRFLQGWFKDTLPTLGTQQFAVVRLDGDMYESTIQAIEQLYPRLSPGGFVIVDDYGAYEACRKAITDYRDANGIDELIVPIDWTGAYWRKSA